MDDLFLPILCKSVSSAVWKSTTCLTDLAMQMRMSNVSTIGCLKYSLIAFARSADRSTPWKHVWYQKFALLNCSIYRFSSENGAMWRSPRDGNILPPGIQSDGMKVRYILLHHRRSFVIVRKKNRDFHVRMLRMMWNVQKSGLQIMSGVGVCVRARRR